jgi:two-component system response regulator AdeR
MSDPKPFALVLEDDPEVGRIIQLTLQMGGFEVVHAPNGFAALNAIDERMPDVMFLDIAMPGMNGWEALYTINEQHPDADFPVIVLTAFDDPFNVSVGMLQSRVFRYLVKPFDPAVLVQTAREAISQP